MNIWNAELNFSRYKSALDANLARVGVGKWGKALNELASYIEHN